MNLFRREGRRKRLPVVAFAGVLFAFQAIALVGAQTASAAFASCSFGSGTLTVVLGANDAVALSADSSKNILIDGATTSPTCAAIPAGNATLTNTTAITVTGTDAGSETVSIDLSVNWGAINWAIDLKGSTADTVDLDGSGTCSGCTGAGTTDLDTVIGASGIDLNDDGDLDATVAGVEAYTTEGDAGDDYICGGGSTIAGGPTTIPMTMTGGTGAGYDDLCGGLGNDTITDLSGAEQVAADYLNFTGPITANLGTGLVSGAGSDTLLGPVDDIYGSAGNDTITGNANYNDIAGGPGDDTIDCVGAVGSGGLLDFWDSAEGVTVDLAAGTATGDGTDTFKNCEDVYGSDFNDSVASDPDVDNFVDGAAGSDWIDYSAYSSDVTVSLGNLDPATDNDPNDDANECDGKSGECDGLLHIENAALGTGDDIFIGNAFNNTVEPNGGANSLTGGGGADTVDYSIGYDAGVTVNLAGGGGAGTDAFTDLFFVNVIGTEFADNITGNESSNTLRSRKGNDNVRGGSGDDTVKAGAGNDLVRAGTGDDDLWGQKGNDSLNGGKGSDFCKGGPGKDVLKSCESGHK